MPNSAWPAPVISPLWDIPLIRGRLFQESDGPDAPHAAVISQTLARRFWPNEDPLGRQIQFGNMDGDLRLLHVVGVVGDVRDEGLDAEARPDRLRELFPAAGGSGGVLDRFARPWRCRRGLTAAMRREARALNPEMPTKFQTVTRNRLCVAR